MADTSNLPALARQQQAALVTFDEMERMADAFAKSNLFGAKTKDQALSLLMIAQAEGIHPALAVMEYDIIEGKPARKAERLLARFQLSGGKVQWKSYTDTNVTGLFSHPQGSDVEVAWTIEMAQKSQYYTKDGWRPLASKYNWKNWPRAMLRSRCISEGVRACFPGAALITLTSEEAQDVQVLSVETTEDFDQRQSEERADLPIAKQGDFMRGAKADAAINNAISRMGNAQTKEELAAAWREAQTLNVSKNRQDGLAEMHARNEERLLSPSPVTPGDGRSIFDRLKDAGTECLTYEAAEERQSAFEVWAGSLTPEKLEACTEAERGELRTLYKNIKAELHG